MDETREEPLEFRYFRKVKIFYFHWRDDHVEGFFPCGAYGGAHQFDIGKHFEDALVETEIAQAAGELAVFN